MIKKTRVFLLAILFLITGLLVVGCNKTPKKTEEQKQFDEAVEIMEPASLPEGKSIKGDFTLPANGANGVKVTWTVDKEDIIKITNVVKDGQIQVQVNKPIYEEGKEKPVITLTATITKGDMEATKEFTFKVDFKDPDTVIFTLKDIRDPEKQDEVKANYGKSAEINDVIVIGIGNEYFVVADNDGRTILVYCGSSKNIPATVKVGVKGNLKNVKFGENYASHQFASVKGTLPSFSVSEENVTLPTPKEYTAGQLRDLIEGKTIEELNTLKNVGEQTNYLKITGKVVVDSSLPSQYSLLIVDREDETKKIGVTYHIGKMYEELKKYDGVDVVLYGNIYEIRDNDTSYKLAPNIRLGIYSMDEVQLNDEQKCSFDSKEVPDIITVQEGTSIDLPATGPKGTTYTYELVNADDPNKDKIDLTNKTVVLPQEGVVVIDVKVITSLNDARVEKQIQVVLGNYKDPLTIDQVKGLTEIYKGYKYPVTGVVAYTDKYATVLVTEDGLHGVVAKIKEEVITAQSLAIGDKVTVKGEIEEKYGKKEISNVEVVSKDQTGVQLTPTEITTWEQVEQLKKDNLGQLLTVNIPDLKVISVGSNQAEIGIAEDKKITLYAYGITCNVDEKVSIERAFLDIHSSKLQFRVFNTKDVTFTALTDAEKVAKIKQDLLENYGSPKEFIGGTDVNLVTTSQVFGGTITWNTDTAAENGKWKNEAGTNQYTITATVNVGEVTETQDIVITVKYNDPSAPVSVTTYNFESVGTKGKEMTLADAKTLFDNNVDGTNILQSVDAVTKVYEGKGTGGPNHYDTVGCIKMGTGTVEGVLTLTFTKNITKVEVYGMPWKNDTLEINTVSDTLNGADVATIYTLDTLATTITLNAKTRALISKIVVYYE